MGVYTFPEGEAGSPSGAKRVKIPMKAPATSRPILRMV